MKKCAIVTGSASGIGRSIAETLANDGCDVVIADINENEGVQTAEEVGGLFVKSDLTSRESCRQLIEKAVTQYGRVDILVNNAGFQHVCPLEDFPEDKWDQMLSLMLTAPFLLTKYAWPYMKERQWGRVVNIASVHGLVASPYKVAYVSAKHGLLGLTRTGLWKAESTELQ
jgi:3-hydroxybutyrate dehydrogenase